MRILKPIVFAGLFISTCSKSDTSEQICESDGVDFDAMFQDRYVQPFKEGRVDDWLEVFTDDAVALHNHRPVDVGRESISGFGKIVAQTFEFAQYDVEVVETRTHCDWAVTRGEYQSEFIFRESGEPAPWGPQKGKFIVIWELQPDGNWKISTDMGNSNE